MLVLDSTRVATIEHGDVLAVFMAKSSLATRRIEPYLLRIILGALKLIFS
jgi:hypothetical protein